MNHPQPEAYVLLRAATVQGTAGASVPAPATSRTFQAWGNVSAGTGSAVVDVYGSMDGVHWVLLNTITLTLGTTDTTGGFSNTDRYLFVRAIPSTLTGTNAAVTTQMGA